MECKFQVGDRVVCVNDVFWDGEKTKLTIGHVYTISQISLGNTVKRRPDGVREIGSVEVYVKEVRNIQRDGREIGWHWSRFRPLESKQNWQELVNKTSRSNKLDVRTKTVKQPQKVNAGTVE